MTSAPPSDRTPLANAPQAVALPCWRLDRRDGRLHCNDSGWALLGLSPAPEGLAADALRAMLRREDQQALWAATRTSLRSGRSATAALRLCGQGGERRLLVSYRALRDLAGKVAGLVGVALDMTDAFDAALRDSDLARRLELAGAEQRRAQAALNEANQRAALAVRAAGMGTWEQDLATLTVYWDEQMFRLRGLEPTGPVAPIGRGRELVHPDDREQVLQAWQTAMRTGEPISYEFRVRWPDGSVHWLASRLTPVKDERGDVVRQIGVNWDITESKTVEAARQQQALALRENQAKSQFLARMSHELRTPLNAVLGFTQLLQLEVDGNSLLPAQRSKLEHVRSAGEYLLTLITDVLDLSSLEAGGMKLELGPVRLAEAVHEAVPLVESQARQHGVAVHVDAMPGDAMADRTRLRQVLVNLLSNAIKYNRPGGEVRIGSQVEGEGVLVRVTDTGQGMSADQLAHLFEPFNRLGREGAGVEGTGIGLAIVKALVTRMGGRVEARSTEGRGSEFTLRLPAASAAAAGQMALRTSTETTFAERAALGLELPSAHILCIEDNPLNVLLIQELVAQRPALRLTCEPNGTRGVEGVLKLRPDLVLVDMQLPDFDGFEVLRRLRAEPTTEGIPCIALSANAMPDDIDRALQAGFAAYWTKPLDVAAFLASLDAMFSLPARR
jgi:PAS domain S-box-containing protein